MLCGESLRPGAVMQLSEHFFLSPDFNKTRCGNIGEKKKRWSWSDQWCLGESSGVVSPVGEGNLEVLGAGE